MIHKICMRTPAGEVNTVEVDDKNAPEHACHTALRLGVAAQMRFIDLHVKWDRPDKPEIIRPFAGPENWLLEMHPAERTCALCKEKAQ